MEDKSLFKIALIGALVGIAVLLIFSNKLSVNEKTISNIDQKDIDSAVKINGVISNIRTTNSTTMIDIAQLDKMMVVVFNSNMTLNKGDYIEVTGKIQEYNGENELVADKIILK